MKMTLPCCVELMYPDETPFQHVLQHASQNGVNLLHVSTSF